MNRVENYNVGFFSYECKVFLIDYNGVVKGGGIGITNTREGRYAKSSGYVVQNTVLKMAKKRALVDAALNVGNLSARFTQDMEDLKDLNPDPDNKVGKNPEDLKPKNGKLAAKDKPATKKQFTLLEKLMKESNSSEAAMNRYVQKNCFLFGEKQRLTIIVPGGSVRELAVSEVMEGGNVHGKSEVTA